MSLANWTTRILPGSVQGNPSHREVPGGAPGDGPGGDAADGGPPTQAATRAWVGRRVGAYLVTKRLGEGGVGEVFKGVDVMLKREVAIKVLRRELAADPLFLERFRHEAQIHAQLAHPNVATVHAFLEEGDTPFMVMEYVPGVSLDEFVRSGGPVPVERALVIFRRALDGIEHAHQRGIVHRDIKPANIMLADSGLVKVMDFGIARALDAREHLTRHGQVAGTAKAMSPEQIRGAQADVRSDIYSLGIVLYTLLAGRAPFDGANDLALMKAQLEQAPPPLARWVGHVPRDVEAAVMRALAKDPAERFQTVADFAQALDACRVEVAAASSLPPGDSPDEARTATRTVFNLELDEDIGAPPLRPGAVARRRRPRLSRRAAALALAFALPALAAGTVFVATRLASPDAPAAAASAPVAVVASSASSADAPAPAEAADSAALPEPALAVAAAPPPADAGVRTTLEIVRVDSDGAAAARPETDHRFRPGERIRLRVTPSRDAHVYCYLQDEARRIVRFYPNRFSPDARVKASAPLEIPGPMRFELVANHRRINETVACFASEQDLMARLPDAVVGKDFARLRAGSLDELKRAFARADPATLAQARFRVEVR